MKVRFRKKQKDLGSVYRGILKRFKTWQMKEISKEEDSAEQSIGVEREIKIERK